MTQNYLIVNPESSSRKYAFFEGKQQRVTGKFELPGNASIRFQKRKKDYTLTDRETVHPLSFFMKESYIPERGIEFDRAEGHGSGRLFSGKQGNERGIYNKNNTK